MVDLSEPKFPTILLYEDAGCGRDGDLNMALDEVLLESSERPWLRWYAWDRPTVSVGYFSEPPPADEMAGRHWVRRWTGGGRVDHGGALDATFSLGVPPALPESRLRATAVYRIVHRALANALDGAGHSTALATSAGESKGGACFANPVRDDVLGPDGLKLAGGALRRSRKGLLHQGSIQGIGLAPPFAGAFARHLAQRVATVSVADDVLAMAEELAERKYRTLEWRERRQRWR